MLPQDLNAPRVVVVEVDVVADVALTVEDAAVVVVEVAEVDSETVADVVVAVDVEVTEEAVVVQPTVVALVTSRARSRLFKSSTLPHTNFSEVRC
jgi:hypothetical protein